MFIKLTNDDGLTFFLRASTVYKVEAMEYDDKEDSKSTIFYNTQDGVSEMEVRETAAEVVRRLSGTAAEAVAPTQDLPNGLAAAQTTSDFNPYQYHK